MRRADELAWMRRVTRPFGHARLAAFFVAVGVIGALGGAAIARSSGASVQRSAAIAAVLCALLGFLGVFAHRLHTWK